MGFMYILRCADGTFYTGSTRDLVARLAQHQRGEGCAYTRRRTPVELVYYEAYELVDHAYLREKQVQGLMRSEKKRLIRDGWGVRPVDGVVQAL